MLGAGIAPGEVTAHISGTVTKNGTGISGLTVWAWSYTSDAEVSAITDANGAFVLGVSRGSWGVEVDATYAMANNLLRSAQYATVTNGQTFSGVPLRLLESTGSITGSVSDPFGNPFSAGGIASAWGVVNGEYYQSYAQVSAAGTFSLPVVVGQEWWVGAAGCPNQSVMPDTVADVRLVRSAITAGPSNQDLSFGENATFSVVVDAPSPTYQWQRFPYDGSNEWVSLSDNASCTGSQSAALTVFSPAPDTEGSLFRCQVSYSFGNSTITDISSAARLLVVTAHLRGQLTRNGAGLGNFAITANKQNQSGYTLTNSVRTDGNGIFDIGVSENGTWSLGIDFGEAMSAGIVSSQIGVDVVNNQNINDVAFAVIDATGTISGNVTDSDGDPVPFVSIWANSQINGQACNSWAFTDGNGFYVLPIADGTWSVGVSNSIPYPQQSISVIGHATMDFSPAQPPVIISLNPAAGSVGANYNQVLSAEGGTPPYTWSLVSGVLPDGLSFDGNGTISGIPTMATTATFTVRVADSGNLFAMAELSLSVISPFRTWEEMNFLAGDISAGKSGPAADPDGDGFTNLLEYALGGSPKVADAATIAPDGDSNGSQIQISFRCDDSRKDLIYTVQSSTDLAPNSWTDIAQSTGGGAFSATAGATVTDPGNGSGHRTVTVSTTLPVGGKLFLRLKAAK